MDCSYCGRYELQLNVRTLDKELVRKLNQKGFIAGSKEEEIPEIRKKELERFKAGPSE
jgi:hypothetical protein